MRIHKALLIWAKVLFMLAVILVTSWWAGDIVMHRYKPKNEPITVSVFYGTLCPDSVDFIRNQLYPVHAVLRDDLIVDFVPFGKAEEVEGRGKSWFDCQHGDDECEVNKLHACAVRDACGEHTPEDCPWERRSRLMEFVFCSLGMNDRLATVTECANMAGLSADNVTECAMSDVGQQLMHFFARRTVEYTGTPIGRKYGSVPAITINGVPNEKGVDDFHGEICKIRPDEESLLC